MALTVTLGALGVSLALTLAVIVARHERRSMAHWLFVAGMVELALENIFAVLTARTILPQERLYWQNCGIVVSSLVPATWLWFSLVYARGNPRDELSRWCSALALGFAAPIAAAVLLHSGLAVHLARSTAEVPWLVELSAPGAGLFLASLLASVLVLVNLERTFRAAVGTMRWRIKYMVLGIGALFAVRAFTISQVLRVHRLDLSFQAVNSGALVVACLLVLRSLARISHFEVGVYPLPGGLQQSVTVAGTGIYLASVGGLAGLITGVDGRGLFGFKALLLLLALALLAVALLSDRLRLKVRRFLSRHLQTPVYNYHSVWRTFTEAASRGTDPVTFCKALVTLVSETFQALSVSIWLVEAGNKQLKFASSTSVLEFRAKRLELDPEQSAELIQILKQHPEPINLDISKKPWAPALRRLQPEEFINGGDRTCISFLAGGEILGIMILGDRVGGTAYSMQDRELLKSLADRAATSLLNRRLAERLAQARHSQIFRVGPAAFVHDGKNTVSGNSITLRNFAVRHVRMQNDHRN